MERMILNTAPRMCVSGAAMAPAGAAQARAGGLSSVGASPVGLPFGLHAPRGRGETLARARVARLPQLSRGGICQAVARTKAPKGIAAMDEATLARAAIFAAPMLWASGAPLSRYLMTLPVSPDPLVVTCAKFAVAGACFAPSIWSYFHEATRREGAGEGGLAGLVAGIKAERPIIQFAFEQALFLCLGNFLATSALQFTPASKLDFITNSGKIVLVPLLSVMYGKEISAGTWKGMGAALVGIALIFGDGALSTEDVMTMVASFCFSVHTTRVSNDGWRFNPAAFTGLELAMVAGMSVAALAAQGIVSPEGLPLFVEEGLAPLRNRDVIGVMVGMGVGSTCLSMLCQTFGQSRVPAAEAQVVYATQPVWAAIYSMLLLGEGLSERAIAGAALVVASSAYTGLSQSQEGKEGEGEKAVAK